MLRRLFFIIFLAVPLFAIAEDDLCICEEVSESDEIWKNAISTSDAVFSGRVDKIIPITSSEYLVDVIVYQSWKEVKDPKVSLLSSSLKKDCGFDFVTGGEYMIFASYPMFLSNIGSISSKGSSPSQQISEKILIASKCGMTQALHKFNKEAGTGAKLLGEAIYTSVK